MLLKANHIKQNMLKMREVMMGGGGPPLIYSIPTGCPDLTTSRLLKKDQTIVSRRKSTKGSQGKHCKL